MWILSVIFLLASPGRALPGNGLHPIQPVQPTRVIRPLRSTWPFVRAQPTWIARAESDAGEPDKKLRSRGAGDLEGFTGAVISGVLGTVNAVNQAGKALNSTAEKAQSASRAELAMMAAQAAVAGAATSLAAAATVEEVFAGASAAAAIGVASVIFSSDDKKQTEAEAIAKPTEDTKVSAKEVVEAVAKAEEAAAAAVDAEKAEELPAKPSAREWITAWQVRTAGSSAPTEGGAEVAAPAPSATSRSVEELPAKPSAREWITAWQARTAGSSAPTEALSATSRSVNGAYRGLSSTAMIPAAALIGLLVSSGVRVARRHRLSDTTSHEPLLAACP